MPLKALVITLLIVVTQSVSMWPIYIYSPPHQTTKGKYCELRNYKQLYLAYLSTTQLPTIQGTYMHYTLLNSIYYTYVVHAAVAWSLPLLPPLLPLPAQLIYKRPLLLLIEHLLQLYTCASLHSSISSANFLYIASYFLL